MAKHALPEATTRATKTSVRLEFSDGGGTVARDTQEPYEDLGKPKGGVTRRAGRTTEGREPEGGR